jgi:ABC-type glutathione transport system ATPase component
MVFQDPFSSMNPVFRVSHGVLRSLKLHRPELSESQRRDEAARVFEVAGLDAEMLQRFAYELSGGQRQRVGFAQALVTRPTLILADEPVSMLDVSIRIGLLNLMAKLRDGEDVSILYITHDIASARYVADRLIVMYAGQIAESGPIEDVLASAARRAHPVPRPAGLGRSGYLRRRHQLRGPGPGRADNPVPRARADHRRLGRLVPRPGGHVVGDARRGRARP